MLYFPTDTGNLSIDSLINAGALYSATSEAGFEHIKQNTPQKNSKEGLPPDFQFMVANGQLETSFATTKLEFQVSDNTFVEGFIVMSNLANLSTELLFLQGNGTLLDTTQGIFNFPSFSM